MYSIIFATNNENKVKEINAIIPEDFQIVSLKEAGINIDIPEPHDTLEANASEKSKVIFELTKKNCFSEDTGLEVEALNNQPGVLSARYAENDVSFSDNMEKLLFHLKDKTNRKAQFRTVISLILDGAEFLFEGICQGTIMHEKKGEKGFGYDPIFVPDGATKTFAEMELDEKNKFSHRKKATEKFIAFLKNYHGKN